MFARVPPARVAAFKEQTALKRTTNAEDVARQVVFSVNLTQLLAQTLVVDSGESFTDGHVLLPNQRMQATANSVRSCLAPAVRRA